MARLLSRLAVMDFGFLVTLGMTGRRRWIVAASPFCLPPVSPRRGRDTERESSRFNSRRLHSCLLRPHLDMRERKFYHCSMLTDHSVRHPLRVIADHVGKCKRIARDPGCYSESCDSAPSTSRPADRAPFPLLPFEGNSLPHTRYRVGVRASYRQFDGTESSGTKWHIYRKEF